MRCFVLSWPLKRKDAGHAEREQEERVPLGCLHRAIQVQRENVKKDLWKKCSSLKGS